MGWLDWSFDRAMATDVSVILLAYRGKVAMLKAIYGSAGEPAIDDLPPFMPGLLSRTS